MIEISVIEEDPLEGLSHNNFHDNNEDKEKDKNYKSLI
jgi:hypothetical protein